MDFLFTDVMALSMAYFAFSVQASISRPLRIHREYNADTQHIISSLGRSHTKPKATEKIKLLKHISYITHLS
jgi:hypothetical protein